MIKDVLRLKLHGKLSHEAIARSLSVSKGVVAKYVSLATAGGLQDWASIAALSEAELERRLFGAGPEQRRVVEPDFGRIHLELRRKGVTLTLLWEEYRAANEGRRTWGLTQFCEHYKAYTKTLRRSMRQQHRAGEKLFVDYAGPTLELADGGRGQVFVAAMGASSYTFACVTADQSMRSWLGAIGRTLRFVGGVPQMIVPDNARALIAEPDRYEPRANDTVLDFARYHDVTILPARPYAPQDKAKVESAVQVVERWILARLRHVRLADVAAADAAVQALLPMLNGRRLQKLDATRASLFAAIDAPALRARPGARRLAPAMSHPFVGARPARCADVSRYAPDEARLRADGRLLMADGGWQAVLKVGRTPAVISEEIAVLENVLTNGRQPPASAGRPARRLNRECRSRHGRAGGRPENNPRIRGILMA